jgi:hypothetical protein
MQYIKTNIGIEQDLVVNYKREQYQFNIRFDEFFKNWYFDLYKTNNNELILAGIKIKLGADIFKGLGLNLGELYLIDTIDDGSEFDIKRDFGGRLKLARIL